MAVGPDHVKFILDQILSDIGLYRDVLAAIGLLVVGKSAVKFTWNLCKGIHTHFLPSFGRYPMREEYGCWAVVTGSTDGIGRAYCDELARQGFHIAMLSRNSEKLSSVAEDISSKYDVEVIYHTVDFTYPEAFFHISELLQDLEIGVLVNNVGVMSRRPSYLVEMSENDIHDHVNVNVLTTSLMTRAVLPQMIERRQGAIINIASISALSPTPLFSVYAATKAYVESFSQAVRQEVSGTDIIVQTLIPSYVATRMVDYNSGLSSSIFTPSPERFVRNAVRTLGRCDYTTGYWLHGLLAWLFQCFPVSLRMWGARRINLKFRKQYLEKSEKED